MTKDQKSWTVERTRQPERRVAEPARVGDAVRRIVLDLDDAIRAGRVTLREPC